MKKKVRADYKKEHKALCGRLAALKVRLLTPVEAKKAKAKAEKAKAAKAAAVAAAK